MGKDTNYPGKNGPHNANISLYFSNSLGTNLCVPVYEGTDP